MTGNRPRQPSADPLLFPRRDIRRQPRTCFLCDRPTDDHARFCPRCLRLIDHYRENTTEPG